MSKIIGTEGLIMNQSNGTAYMQVYSRGINSSGAFLRFTIAGGNPNMHVMVKMYYAFTQTNANDFNTAGTVWKSLQIDTGGTTNDGFGYGWFSGPGVDIGWTLSTRQADLWIANSSVGGFPGRASVNCEIFCNRWDYLTLTNIN